MWSFTTVDATGNKEQTKRADDYQGGKFQGQPDVKNPGWMEVHRNGLGNDKPNEDRRSES